MRVRSALLTLSIICIACGVMAENQPRELHIVDTIRVRAAIPLITIGELKSDLSGNIYIRAYDPQRVTDPVILKVSADGKDTTRFDLSAVEHFKAASNDDFTIAGDGTVYVLASRRNSESARYADTYIVQFDKDGRFSRTTQLDAPAGLMPSQVAVFGNGNFFVAGAIRTDAESSGRHFTGLFDSQGQFILEVRLPDLPQTSAQKATKKEATPGTVPSGVAVAGGDGNVYLMKRTRDGPIYVISPSGTVIRNFQVSPPADGAVLVDIKVNQAAIAVMFAVRPSEPRTKGSPTVFIQVLNPITGELTVEYVQSDPRIGLEWIGFSLDEFTFLGGDKEGAKIVRTSAR